MRRMVLMTAVLSLTATLGFAGAASAGSGHLGVGGTHSQRLVVSRQSETNVRCGRRCRTLRLKPGTEWTLTNLITKSCEVQTFEVGNAWTADYMSDAGTYSNGRESVIESWLAGYGQGVGEVYGGSYSKRYNEFIGTLSNSDGMRDPTTLSRGAMPGC